MKYLIIGLSLFIILLISYILYNKSKLSELTDKINIDKKQENIIFKNKENKNITLTTVVGINSKKYLREIQKLHKIKTLKFLNVQTSINSIVLPTFKQIQDIDTNKLEYVFDTINTYFKIHERVIISKNKIILIRDSIIVLDTVNQVLTFGKLSIRILRIPIFKFEGIGVGGNRDLISEIKHSNPFIKTTYNKIIINNNYLK